MCCSLAAAALDWCNVLGDRHHAVRASCCMGSWAARACTPVRITPYGQLPGLLFWISLGIRGLLRLVASGRSMISSFRCFTRWCL